ncbi:MAG: hypothetical protein LQ348_005787 [Seirophora lacunosa]|nr:MAG: hypothetical protein LQ344_000418 [Seirophora lacunosa]KAI4177605.1 MAG: hypothetical protein LQ348_005787 [Seirophora lacunosa]
MAHLPLPILLTILTLLSSSLTAPVNSIEERHILTETHILPRQQQNIPQLLSLASLAGITLPTDTALLLSLGPVAARLGSYLPTPSVLSVLVTAAPSDFLSNVVHDPAYASSFQQAFADGNSPSWFRALPTDVKSYLHTYSGYGAVATAVGEIDNAARETAASTGTDGQSATSETVSGMTSTTGSATTASETSADAQSTSPPPAEQSAGTATPNGVAAMTLPLAMGVVAFAIAL